MTGLSPMLLAGVYVLLGRWLVAWRDPRRELPFALLNLGLVYLVFFGHGNPLWFGIYLLLVGVQYLTLRWWSGRAGGLPWLAFLTPLLFLAVVRYLPPEALASVSARFREKLQHEPGYSWSGHFIGLSYMAFRTSYLVLEIRNGLVPRPGFWTYLGFAFFAPTFSVGPISPFSLHRQGLIADLGADLPAGRAALRVLVGAVKYLFLAPVLDQLTYRGLLLDGYHHQWSELPVAGVAYFLYLYCNFSGFCDIAIGGAGLMKLKVAENFDNPLIARNLKDFWNRWHISLSHYMRDVVFSPLSKSLVGAWGPARSNHAIAAAIFVVFLLVGVWHGVGWNYVAFGALHAFGLVANHYYTIALKRRLGKTGFAAYNQNRAIHVAAVALTFSYNTVCLCLFANDWETLKTLFRALE